VIYFLVGRACIYGQQKYRYWIVRSANIKMLYIDDRNRHNAL